MSNKFHPEKTRILQRQSLPGLIVNSLSMGIILSLIYVSSLIRYGWNIGESLPANSATYTKAAAITLTLLVIIQIISAFNLRNRAKSLLQRSFLANPYLIFTSLISILIIYFLITYEPVYSYLKLNSLSIIEWEIILFSALVFLIIEEIRKIFARKYEN